MPLIYAALETPVPAVQEKALRIVPVLAESLDYTTVKNSLFPRVQVSPPLNMFHRATLDN
jgi:SCY1-like protein 2